MSTCSSDGRKHYEVLSPEVCTYAATGVEPAEYGCDYALVLASNKREARKLALSVMQMWPNEARGDGRNPFADLTVYSAECEHGVCWGCDPEMELGDCPQCEKELHDELEADMMTTEEDGYDEV